MTSNTPDLIPSEDAAQPFDLDAWIDGISPTQRSVTIYARPDLYGRYEEIQRQIKALESVAHGEGSVAEQGELGALYAEREALYAQQLASKTTWYLQALDGNTMAELGKAHPVPDLPTVPPRPTDSAPKSVHDAYDAAVKKRDRRRASKAYTDAVDAQNIAYIRASLVKIEDHAGRVVATSVTDDQLRAIQAKPYGNVQLGSLLAAAMQAKATEPVIPAPFSHAKRENAPG